MECRVFRLDVGWGYCLFHFPMEIGWKTIKSHIRTSNLEKKDFLGKYEFDEQYLEHLESDVTRTIKYYFIYYMSKEDNE